MPASDVIRLAIAALVGAVLAVFYFGGLWWTVRRLPTSPRPALLTGLSLVVRLGVTVTGFHLVGDGRWENLLACLAGFLVGRTCVIHRLNPGILSGTSGPSHPPGPSSSPTER